MTKLESETLNPYSYFWRFYLPLYTKDFEAEITYTDARQELINVLYSCAKKLGRWETISEIHLNHTPWQWNLNAFSQAILACSEQSEMGERCIVYYPVFQPAEI